MPNKTNGSETFPLRSHLSESLPFPNSVVLETNSSPPDVDPIWNLGVTVVMVTAMMMVTLARGECRAGADQYQEGESKKLLHERSVARFDPEFRDRNQEGYEFC